MKINIYNKYLTGAVFLLGVGLILFSVAQTKPSPSQNLYETSANSQVESVKTTNPQICKAQKSHGLLMATPSK